MSLSKIHRQNLKNVLFFQQNKLYLESADKIKKNIEIKFYFFHTFRKIKVEGFVNQLIKKIWPKTTLCRYVSKKDGKDQETIQSSTTPDPGYHMGK